MIDWQTGTWQRTDTPAPGLPTWRVTVASDWAPFKNHETLMVNDPPAVYGDLLPILAASDLNIVNVEAVLGEVGQPIPKAGPCLKGDERAVAALNAGHFHVATLANNHIKDFDVAGLRHTMDVLHGAGIDTVGAAVERDDITRPLVRTVQGVKVGLINCGEGEACRSERGRPGVHGLDVFDVARQIHQLKSTEQADVVIVVFHGGREYVPVPPPYIVTALRQIASAGADAVIAHHPHVPQPIEVIDGVPIAYSLGNFVFWRDQTALYQRIGYLMHLDFTGKQLTGCAVTPYVFWPEGLRVMTADQQAWFHDQMAQAARPLASEDDIWEAWEAYAALVGPSKVIIPMLSHAQSLHDALAAGQTPDPQVSAQFKNGFYTPAHQTLYSLLLDRLAFPRPTPPADWAMDLQTRWRDTLLADNALMSSRPA